MIIDDPDAFKAWLTSVLKPLCEADPSALAKYVFALVKKDKSIEVLRQSMVNQLEVFLQNETEPFVELLFKTLDTKDYLTPVIPSANPPNPNVPPAPPEAVVLSPTITKPKEVKQREIIPVNELPNLNEPVNGSAVVKKDPKEAEIKRDKEIRKSDSEKEEKPRLRPRRVSTSHNRSRSRSWDRNRRSRSPDKRIREPYHPEREPYHAEREAKRVRPYRNKSPPRRYERRRTPSPGRVRSRSRSPRHSYRGRYRNRSPPRSGSRSRSRSLDRKDHKDGLWVDKEGKESRSGAGTPTQDSNHGDMDLRLTTSAQSIQSVVVHQNSSGNRSPKKRCRDYDEKGFCMRGEMCPYDHGVDPVVLEDSALTRVLTYAPNGAPPVDVPPPMVPPPIIPPAHAIMHHMPPRPLPPEYNPQAPQMWHRPGFRGPRPMLGPRPPLMGHFGPQNNVQRELIPIPVMDNQRPERFDPNFMRQPHYNQMEKEQHEGMFKKKNFDFARLGPRSKNPANCSLELKKVPTGMNNISHLNNHFSKFGKIVNIQVFYEGNPEAALVTFSSHAEANAAYRSTEAVLNNRFIKVFWHSGNPDGKQENVPPRSVKERLGMPNTVAPNSNKVLNLVQPKAENILEDSSTAEKALNNIAKNSAVANKEENKAQAAAAIKMGQELLAAKEKLKKNHEEKRKEAIKLTQNLRKRKQELLEKQLAQQKLLIDKMEKTPPGPQRDLLMQTIKKSQEATEAIRKDMMSQPPVTAKTIQPRKSKEEVQKEVLDAELELITKQQEGADTTELQKKLLELKARITAVGRTRSMRGRRFNPISRHLLTKNNLIDNAALKTTSLNRTSFQKHAVDHRPTRLLVSGYEEDEQENVVKHFSQFGEIVDYVADSATPSIVLNYKSRKEAEVALLKGKNFQDRTLSITWCNNAQLSSQLSGRTSTRTVLVSESDEDHLIEPPAEEEGEHLGPEISEELLLQDDEEEDEENEGRSWRR